MAELKKEFEKLGFGDVQTYLNSGNAAFSSDKDDIRTITKRIEIMIKNRFTLDSPVFVISKKELEDILHNAPDWWGTENKEIYDNLFFIIPPAAFAQIYSEIGEPKAELKKIKNYKKAYSGLSSGKIIKKQTGGLKRQVQLSAVN